MSPVLVPSNPQPGWTWTAVQLRGAEICNSLEQVEWTTNPVQVIVCSHCGTPGCAYGGYVHMSRLAQYVLWTTPQIEVSDDDEPSALYAPLFALRKLGAIAVDPGAWMRWEAVSSKLPKAASLPQANGRAVAEAWALGPGRPVNLGELVPMLRARLLGCDTLNPTDAIGRIERCLGRLQSLAMKPAPGSLQPLASVGASVETLYFDGPKEEDWAALAVKDDLDFPLLDREHIFILSA
jgi:hypothetical protein